MSEPCTGRADLTLCMSFIIKTQPQVWLSGSESHASQLSNPKVMGICSRYVRSASGPQDLRLASDTG